MSEVKSAQGSRVGTNESPWSIPDRFTDTAKRYAHRLAISAPNAEWTYAELDQRSNALALLILDCVGDSVMPVALLMEHGAPLIAAILAVLKAGRIYTVLDPGEPVARLAATAARTSLLLTDETQAPLAAAVAAGKLRVIRVDETLTGTARSVLPNVLPSTGAWLMHTSGSSGVPKGVWQDHAGVIRQSELHCECTGLTPEDRLSLLTPCHLAASATALFSALLNGAALCPFHLRSHGIERLAGWLRRERITLFHSVPTVFRHLARTVGREDVFESVRVVRLGGEAVLRSDVEAFQRLCPVGSRLMHAFSSTETGLISVQMIDKETELPNGRVSVGFPVGGVEVMLLDEHGGPVPAGGAGRIAVRSGHLAQGYWEQPEATAAAFRRDPSSSGCRTFVTNDLGRLSPDGSLEHLGRADQVVKIRGHRIDLCEVEAALRATGLVEEVAVSTAGDDGERRLVAYVVSRLQTDPTEYRRSLRSHVPEHLIPSDYIALDRLPQTSGGKIDRRALAPPPSRRPAKSLSRYGGKPRDGIETRLARIWHSVLQVRNVGRDEDFFDLGGTSLHSAQVMTQIESVFNVVLAPSTLAEHSTIEKLAALLADQTVNRSTGLLVTLRAAESGRPLFFVHDGKGDVSAYSQLARRLPGRPVYGLQSCGLRGERWPLTTVPAMAARYVEEVVRADPTGPYLLAATCMGGLVAFEIARRLVDSGRPVGLLALMDTIAPPFSGRRPYWHELMLDPVRDWFRMLCWWTFRAGGFGRGTEWLPGYRRFVSRMNNRAARRYRPSHYSGTLTLFLTADARRFRVDRRPMMSRYARATRTITIPGDRRGLFVPPAVDELARQLQGFLETV